LKVLYNKSSELSHANRRTFSPHLHLKKGSFSFQDVRDEDIPRLIVNYLIWICAAHLIILEVADFVFPEGSGDRVARFKRERQDMGEKLTRFNNQNDGQYL